MFKGFEKVGNMGVNSLWGKRIKSIEGYKGYITANTELLSTAKLEDDWLLFDMPTMVLAHKLNLNNAQKDLEKADVVVLTGIFYSPKGNLLHRVLTNILEYENIKKVIVNIDMESTILAEEYFKALDGIDSERVIITFDCNVYFLNANFISLGVSLDEMNKLGEKYKVGLLVDKKAYHSKDVESFARPTDTVKIMYYNERG